MTAGDDDEVPLRSLAVQNAAAIHLSRQRIAPGPAGERELLQVTLASIGDAVISTDGDGRVTFLNPIAEALTGWPAAEAFGRPLADVFRIVDERTRRPAESSALRALREGTVVGLAHHTALIARDGSEHPIDDSAAPIRDDSGHSVGAVLVFRDVTERRRADEARVRLAAIVESSEDAIISKTLDGIIRTWNAGAERLFGYTASEAVGRHITLIIPFERLDEETVILARLVRGERVESFETVRVARDGRRLDISLTVSPLRDADGHVIGASKIARDITAQKRAEAALRESEARYRAIVESTPECVKLVAADGTVLQMNPAGLQMLEATADDVLGRCVYDVVAPEHRQSFQAFHERVCRGEGGALTFDLIGLRGTRRHMETTAVPLRAPDGGFTHLAVSRDVTHKTASERALADSRARLDIAVRLSGVGFWYCDLPFAELEWDDKVKEHFWLPPAARVTIDTFYERMHPDDRARTRASIDTSIRDRVPYDIDYRTVDPATGAIKWIRALGGAVWAADGTPMRFDGVTVDITAPKRDEERLAIALAREQEHGRTLRAIADASLTIHSAGAPQHVLQAVADEARRIVGAAHAASGLAHDDPTHASDALPAVGDAALHVCRTNRPLRLAGAALTSWASDLRPPRSWLAAPLVGRDGNNLGLVQLWDKLDGEFTESDEVVLAQLAHIASVALENARLYAAMQEQDRRKDEFLALLAHELRNPLAPLRNGLEVMRLAADPAIQGRAQAVMDRQLGHMVRLIDDLLDVSRINRNKMDLRRSRITLADVVSNAVETARPLIDAARHTLEIVLPPRPVLLDADLTRLAQVFSNLLTNSAKYTPPGGRIRLTAIHQSGSVSVAVHDDGLGIPPEALSSIFDMFSQIDRSIERSNGGLGIGLALVKGLVEMHGGTVAAESPGPGQGSTFTVRLPTADPRPEQPAAARFGGGPCTGRRVLVVDDNEDSTTTMALMLKLLGHDVQTAHDGLAAVHAAETFLPDVILMDMGMPRLNGYDATQRIRAQPWGRAVFVVALTGWGQESDRARSRAAGCDRHLVKPVSLSVLQKLFAELEGVDAPH